MNFLYILQSEKNGSFYVGSTTDINRRLVEHNSGKTASLKHLIPLRLVFQQSFDTIIEARKMERRLKKFKSRKIIEAIIKDGGIITNRGL